jgi:opacity protein-like surface antigen
LSLGDGAGGAHAGYNYQLGQYVLGVEGDVDFADLNASGTGLYLGGTVFRKPKQLARFHPSSGGLRKGQPATLRYRWHRFR